MNNAEALRMAADGKFFSLQYQDNSGGWADLSSAMPDAILKFARCEWADCWEFRSKPRTVKIGSREVEAPVLEPEDGQRLWWWDNYHDGPCDGKPSKDEASNGEWFASAEAARGAYSAYTALLRGDA